MLICIVIIDVSIDLCKYCKQFLLVEFLHYFSLMLCIWQTIWPALQVRKEGLSHRYQKSPFIGDRLMLIHGFGLIQNLGD